MRQAEPSAESLASIRLAVFDFDGVFTDNYVSVDGDGGETVVAAGPTGLASGGCVRPAWTRRQLPS